MLKKISIVLLGISLGLYGVEPPMVYPVDVTVHSTPATHPADVMVYPLEGDSDGDGVPNIRDLFPGNPNEWLDTDHDGIGNNADKDDDGDGIGDALERANGLNPLNAADTQADFDHDGFSNLIEILAGTNIRNAQSKPTWVPVIMGDIIIYVPAIS